MGGSRTYHGDGTAAADGGSFVSGTHFALLFSAMELWSSSPTTHRRFFSASHLPPHTSPHATINTAVWSCPSREWLRSVREIGINFMKRRRGKL
jgi:hypothetical protein